MYTDVVHRTQIYLDEAEETLLDEAAAITGASRSELVRRAVRSTFGRGETSERLAALRESAGTWRYRRGSGAAYVEARRRGSAVRRRRLGLERSSSTRASRFVIDAATHRRSHWRGR